MHRPEKMVENEEVDENVFEHCTPLFDDSYWCLLSRGLHGPPPAVAPHPIPASSAGKNGAAADDNGGAASHDNSDQPKVDAAAANPADPAGAGGGGREDPAVAEPVKNKDANPTKRIRHRSRSPRRYSGNHSMTESSSRRPPNPYGRRIITGCFQLPEGWIADPRARPSGRIDVERNDSGNFHDLYTRVQNEARDYLSGFKRQYKY